MTIYAPQSQNPNQACLDRTKQTHLNTLGEDQSSILVDYGFHLINTQVPLILTRLDRINQESKGLL